MLVELGGYCSGPAVGSPAVWQSGSDRERGRRYLYQVLVLASPGLLLFFNALSLAMFLGRITKCTEPSVTRTIVDLQTKKDSVLNATLAVALRQESKY